MNDNDDLIVRLGDAAVLVVCLLALVAMCMPGWL